MKNYFDFKLDGGKIFPYFIAIWFASFAFLITYIIFFYPLMHISPTYAYWVASNPIGPIATFIFLIFAELLCTYSIYRLFIRALSYKGIPIKFDGRFDEYVTMILKGTLFSIITFGFYSYWFMKKYVDFFANHSSYQDKRFEFKGTGIALFIIALCSLIPYIGFLALAGFFSSIHLVTASIVCLILAILPIFVMSYLIYKWYINFKYDTISASLRNGEVVSGTLFLIGQSLLMLITLGLYAPAMQIRLYRYFVRKTEIKDEMGVVIRKTGCDLRMSKDFFYIFGQNLLILFTLGIYTPWAWCFIAERFVSKTYIEEV